MPYQPFTNTLDMLVFLTPVGLREINQGNADPLMMCSFSLTLLVALIALLIPDRRYRVRHPILVACASLSMPSYLLSSIVSIWVYNCINIFVCLGASAFVIFMTIGVIRLSVRYEMTSRMHAMLRILAVWTPMTVTMFITELICYMVGYQIVVA